MENTDKKVPKLADFHLDSGREPLPAPFERRSLNLYPTNSARVQISLQRLEDAANKFEQTYSDYKKKTGNIILWNDSSISTILDRGMEKVNVFEKAAAVSHVINETLKNRDMSNPEKINPLAKSISGFIARMFPFIRILLELGGTTAQVLHNSDCNCADYHRPEVVCLQLLFYAELSPLWKFLFALF